MHSLRATALLSSLLFAGSPLPAQAGAWGLNGAQVIAVPEGPTSVDLLGSGQAGLVVRGYRQNYNAHSLHYLTFYVTYPDSESGLPRWDIVPFNVASEFQPGFATSQGSDCVLRDLRLLKLARRTPTAMILIVADRGLGQSFADSERVTFTRYELRTNTSGAPGEPGIYFAPTDTMPSARKYCDVGEAFLRELGIGRSGS